MADRVSNELLLNAGLALMKSAGKPLERVVSGSRAMIYKLSDGATVRVRTCNDHILVVLATSADMDARLNIEGTDHLLIVMPETARTSGNILAYFLPTQIAVSAVRQTHADWLATNPATKGNNRTWNIWFDDDAAKSGGFGRKWSSYRLSGNALTTQFSQSTQGTASSKSLGNVIAEARQQIAAAAGVPIDAVKITVALD